jgi:copper chaperone
MTATEVAGADGMERKTIGIGGMSCGHCVARVTKALREVSGVEVEQVRVGSATVRFDPETTPEERITQAIEEQGYAVT